MLQGNLYRHADSQETKDSHIDGTITMLPLYGAVMNRGKQGRHEAAAEVLQARQYAVGNTLLVRLNKIRDGPELEDHID